jgi:manganese/zinc/iron transport system ATP- binding protein
MKVQPTYAVVVKDLTVAYDQNPVLWDADFYAPAASLTAIVGPNGGGKSTLLKSILGLIHPATGSITILQDSYEHKKDVIAYVPQKNSVDWNFPITVFDVVLMGRYKYLDWMRRPKAHDKDIAYEALKQVNMHEYANRHINHLSGGQQQRIFLARALAQEALIYFMDEPFVGIDTTSEDTILELLQNLKTQGKTIIVVHHNLQRVQQYFDWTALINISHVAIGPTKEVLTL